MTFIKQLKDKIHELLTNKYSFLTIYLSFFVYYTFRFLEKSFEMLVELYPKSVKSNIYYFDFETTGLNPFYEHIIDYAFIRQNTQTFGSFDEKINPHISSLVNPQVKFEKKITDITGIHPDDLENKEPIKNHEKNIINFIYSAPKRRLQVNKYFFIAHNVDGFDKFFLNRIFLNKKYDKYRVNEWVYIDTLLLAKKLLPVRGTGYSLSNLAKGFDITPGNHRAYDDTLCLQKVYYKLMYMLCIVRGNTIEYYYENPQKVYDFIHNDY